MTELMSQEPMLTAGELVERENLIGGQKRLEEGVPTRSI
jgi:hypothetical protein